MLCIRFLLQPVDNDSDDFVMASPKKDSARRKLSLGRKYSVIKFKLLFGLHASFIKVHLLPCLAVMFCKQLVCSIKM